MINSAGYEYIPDISLKKVYTIDTTDASYPLCSTAAYKIG